MIALFREGYMTFNELIEKRYSVRKLSDQKID